MAGIGHTRFALVRHRMGGCCSSRRAGATQPPEKRPLLSNNNEPHHQHTAHHASDAVAAGFVGGAATGIAVAGAKATGVALMELASQVPIVAPVAYLVGAVAQSASTAVSLKSDAAEFGRVVAMLENVLCKAESLESQTDVIDDVRASLEEALQFMEDLQARGWLHATLLSHSDKSRFHELKAVSASTRVRPPIA